MGLGTLVFLVNITLIWAYTLSCHSCRHIVGGKLKHFSKHPVRYRLWQWVGKLNARHMLLAWASLVSVALADFYVYLVASGAFDDPTLLLDGWSLLMSVVDRQEWDVVVVGAGGAGLRAAIEARERGARTAVICKSLFGKAHTVMAEGGIAAAMGNVNSGDNWQVHFRDTMRGGKFLNQWRMAELHAQEAPDRVWELETWGALFDRTPRRPDLAAQLRRPRVPASRARRRPHRPGADPHPPAEDRLPPAGGQDGRPATTSPG